MREGREGREYWMDRGNRPDARYLPAPGTMVPDSRYSRYFGPETSRREKKVVVEEAPYEGPTIFDKAGSSCLLSWLLSFHVSCHLSSISNCSREGLVTAIRKRLKDGN